MQSFARLDHRAVSVISTLCKIRRRHPNALDMPERESVSDISYAKQRTTHSFLTTRASKTMGLLLSYSINSFILAGRSAIESHRIALTPMASANFTKSGFFISV